MSRVQLALNVADLEEAIAFYSKLFATPPAKVRDGYANFAVTEPPLKLVLIAGAGEPGTLNHLGVEVGSTEEVAAAVARLQAEGLATDVQEQTTCCYAVQDKVWVTGPAGEPWEVYTVLADAPVMQPTGCCGAEAAPVTEAAPQAEPVALVRARVRDHYAAAARVAAEQASSSCCGAPADDRWGVAHYDADERSAVPALAGAASLGCGNPTAVADLRPGEVVLDLGSGAGIDVLLSARRVGPTGRVYGLDMTPEMLELARRNAAEAGADNVEFLEGHIEEIPLPDASVDVVISNCVVNLSGDKPAVFAEMHRVLRPGGRVGLSDVVADDDVTPEQRAALGSVESCIGGALAVGEYRAGLEAAGFRDVTITRTYEIGGGMHGAIVQATA